MIKPEKIRKYIYPLLNCLSGMAGFFIKRPRVSILMYHSIGANPVFFTAREEDFKKQLAYIKKHGYKVIPLRQLAEKIIKREELEDKTVVLTFDDGYMDNFLKAWPLLKKYNFPAVIFLATGAIGGELNNSENFPLPVLSAEQIKEMAGSGLIEFGAHTHTHPISKEISRDEFYNEAKQSKEIIEKITGQACRYFAYPRGYYRKDFFKILENLGYEAACGIEEGLITNNDNLFLLKRNFIYSQGGFSQFKGKLTYSVLIYNWLRKIIKI